MSRRLGYILLCYAMVSYAFAKEPPVESTAMLDCAIYSGLGNVPNQKTYVAAGIFLYDKEYGSRSYSKWHLTDEGRYWLLNRKRAILSEITSWSPKDVVIANFDQRVKDCDIRYGLIDKKHNLRQLGIDLGYVKE